MLCSVWPTALLRVAGRSPFVNSISLCHVSKADKIQQL